MNFFKDNLKKLVALLCFFGVVGIFSAVRAATSTGFTGTQQDAMGTESNASSANYQIKWRVGLPVSGQLTGGAYVLDVGPRWSSAVVTPTSTPTTTPTTTPTPVPPPVTPPSPVPTSTMTSTPPSTTTPTPTTTPSPTTTPPASTSTPPSTTTPPQNPPTSSTTPPSSNQPPNNQPPDGGQTPGPGKGSATPPSGIETGAVVGTIDISPSRSSTAPVSSSARATSTSSPVVRAANSVASTLKAASRRVALSVKKFATENAEVVTVASKVVSPAAAGIAAASLALQVPFAGLLNLFQLFFFQPVLLFGYGKRIKAGQVYNTLSKLPIDLALVRLIDAATGRIVQSRVTNKNGLFFFQAPPGMYRIEVAKEGLVFPSKLLAGRRVDGRKSSIYHGEPIAVTENYPLITPNVPLDPVSAEKPLRRMVWESWARRLQTVLGLAGVFVTLASIVLSPRSSYLYVLLALHVVLFAIFKRLAVPPKPKGWGVVYDLRDKKPLGRAVARLFNTEFNKLVATQVTDPHGRYYFLAGDSNYQVRFERKDYQSVTSDPIDLSGKDAETIDLEVGLKKSDTPPPQSV